MRIILLIPLLFLSCQDDGGLKPIEQYKNKGIIVIKEPREAVHPNDRWVRCKTKDSIFYIRITDFDAKNLKIGDTIK